MHAVNGGRSLFADIGICLLDRLSVLMPMPCAGPSMAADNGFCAWPALRSDKSVVVSKGHGESTRQSQRSAEQISLGWKVTVMCCTDLPGTRPETKSWLKKGGAKEGPSAFDRNSRVT